MLYYQIKMKALTFLCIVGYVSCRAEMPEDRDLTGCSVQLNGNIFNYGELALGDEEGDSDY